MYVVQVFSVFVRGLTLPRALQLARMQHGRAVWRADAMSVRAFPVWPRLKR